MALHPLMFPLAPASVAGMAVTALVMVLTPGPNMMYLTSRSIGQGRRAGLVSLAGTVLGFIVYMLMANVGLAIVFVAVPWLFIGFKAVGVAYLGWLAWQALRPGGAGDVRGGDLPRDSDGSCSAWGWSPACSTPRPRSPASPSSRSSSTRPAETAWCRASHSAWNRSSSA